MANYQDIGTLGGLLSGLGTGGSGLLGGASPYVYNNTYTTANASSQIVYLNPFEPAAELAPAPVAPDDEFTWLRKRVADTCWKKAA